MKKICVMNIWIGPFPSFYPLWELSATRNPSIDFVVISDRKEWKDKENIRYIYMELEEIKKRIQLLFPFEIKLERAYKLCDYKPVWSLAFPEIVEGYDFCGYCDFDLIFGNIRSFITEEILERYDKILEQGNFTLYRNTDEVKNLFRQSMSKDNMAYPYKAAFQCNYACYFDEYMGMNILGWKNPRVLRDQTQERMVLDFGWQKLNFESYITGRTFLCRWKNGELYRYFCHRDGTLDAKALPTPNMLVHIQKRAMEIEFEMDRPEDIGEFWIIPNRFTLQKPQGPLHSEAECRVYEHDVKRQDRLRQLRNVRENGIVDYIPHFFRSRRIKKWIAKVKKFY